MGIWHPHTNVGTAHFAEYSELPAKKIWSWASMPTASIGERRFLTTTARMRKSKRAFLGIRKHMRSLNHGSTSVFPNIGCPFVAPAESPVRIWPVLWHLEREGNALEASLNVNQKVPSATLQVLDGNVSLFSEKADLTPEKTWIKKVVCTEWRSETHV